MSHSTRHTAAVLEAIDPDQLSAFDRKGYDALAAAGFFTVPLAPAEAERAREMLRQIGIRPEDAV